MRLTLRTLLAWLDGILPPEEHQLVGEKVSAGQFASMLSERIRSVVTRPAIGAPAPDARGLAADANSVAQFIHSTLPAEQLEPFERICFDSDMHLAEVAACYSMFAEWTRDPSVLQCVDDHSLSQLKTLVRQRLQEARSAPQPNPAIGGADQGHQESRETARALRAALGGAAAEGSAGIPRPQNGEATPGMPVVATIGGLHEPPAVVNRDDAVARGPVSKRSSRTAWLSAIVAVSLLAMLSGVLAWSVLRKSGRRTGPQQVAAANGTAAMQPAAAVEPAAAAPGPEALATAEPRQSEAAATNMAVAKPPPSDAEADAEAAPAVGTGSPAAAGAPLPPAAGSAAVATAGAAGAMPRVEASPAGVDATSSVPDRPKPAAAMQPVAAQFVVGGGTLLRLVNEKEEKEWQFAAVETPLRSGDELLVPPWCEATLKIGGVTVKLLSFANVIISTARDGTPWLEVLSGRVVVESGPGDRIGVTTGGVIGVISANPADKSLTKIAIEAGADRFVAADAAAPAQSIGSITGGRQPFIWQPTGVDGAIAPGTRPIEVVAGSAVAWRGSRAELMTGVSPPSWLDFPEPLDRYHKLAAETLAAKIATGQPLLLALKELADGRKVEYRMIAAATLALIGESDALVEMLAAESSSGNRLENRQWEMLEAMAVPAVMASGGDAAAGLHKSFVKYGPREKTDLIWAMARGFSNAEIAGGADRILVAALDDPSLMIRRYAYKTLCDITRPSATDRLQYRPDGLPELRRDGAAWWRGQLERGLIHR